MTAEDEVPVIDLSAGDEESRANELVKAFCTMGFATLVNHGIEMSAIDNAFAASKTFFDLPLDKKRQYPYQGHTSNRGFIEMGNETHENGSSFDRKETFDIGFEGDSDFSTPWPEDLASEGFKEDLLKYYSVFDALHLRLLKLLAIGLKLDSDFFAKDCDEKHCNLRLLHYPKLHRESVSNGNQQIERGALHTDYGTVTLLTQDQTGGLRVKRLDGSWTFLRPVAGGIVVNVGDMLQMWTGGKLRATPHQVVEHPGHAGGIIPERYSIAFFCNANKDVMLKPLQLDPDEPAKYPPIRSLDYLTKRLAATIAK